MRKLIIIVATVFCVSVGYSQYPAGHIPVSNRQEWNKAGLQDKSTLKVAARLINFNTDTLAGIGENDEKINKILENLSGDELTIIYFPEGEYTFYEPIIINKDNVVLQGAGSKKTKLYFENAKSDPGIYISGGPFGFAYDVVGPVLKGNKIITPNRNISSIKDKWVHFYESKSGYGQITKVIDSRIAPSLGKTIKISLTLKDKTTKNYDTNDLKIAIFTPRQNVGIENLKIEKKTKGKGDGGSSIYFIKAVNCWVTGVESSYTSEHHIRLNYCSHIEISGNYLHHSQYYGEGGFGYGINVQTNTTNSLVENNILKHLRHSIALQKGANCNVVAYNYSYDRRSYNDDIFSPENQSCDLVLHGNYSWGNLFDQNNVAAIAADNTHGRNGPYNVFMRNKARADGIIALEPGWYPFEYGLVLYKASQTSLLGNIISNNDIDYNSNDLAINIFGKEIQDGEYDDWQSIKHIGSIYRKAKDDPNAYILHDESYYYDERPAFLPEEYTYPSIGPKPASGIDLTQNIPAHGRVKNDRLRTVNNNPTVYPVALTLITKTDESIDTTWHNVFSFQPFKIADSLVHPQSAEKYFFAGIEESEVMDYNKISNEITPNLAEENIYTVIYKKKQRSSDKDAYSSNNQRKFVKTGDGSLHNIYESMGHVFLETKAKSDNWKLLSDNDVNLFLDKQGAGSPAIDYAKNDDNYNNLIGITYQAGSEIHVNTLYKEDGYFTLGQNLPAIQTGIYNDVDLSPNIAWGGQGVFLVLWEDSVVNPGINYRLFNFSDSYTQIDFGIITGTNDSSGNATLSVWFDDSTNNNHFDIVWEQYKGPDSNTLHHSRLTHQEDGTIILSSPNLISRSTFKKNTNASLVSLAEGAMVCWLVGFDNRRRPIPVKTVMRNAITMGDFYLYDNYTKSTAINKFNDDSGYYFGWSKYYFGKWYNYFVVSDNLSHIRHDIFTKGNELQLSNIDNINDLDVMAYYHDSSPYYFQSMNLTANSNELLPVAFNESKGFTFSKNSIDFDYLIGNIKVDGDKIGFDPESASRLKHSFLSTSFNLSKNSVLTFDESFGVSEVHENSEFLESNDYVVINIEMVDATGKFLDRVKEIKVSRENLKKYASEPFSYVNNDIESAYVKIKITLQTNFDNINLTHMNYYYNDDKKVNDSNVEEITVIKNFALGQNYPNPFNPLTKINYQLPKEAKVTIVIYDILGREVAVLVNEEKDTGKYTAVFDASEQAAGLYIYQMTAGDYSEARKMILIK